VTLPIYRRMTENLDKLQICYDISKDGAKGNALFLATLAGLAYKSQLEIEHGLRDHGYRDTKVWFFRGRLSACFIVEWGDVIAIAFRGSSNWREWLNNCNMWPKLTPYGRVHAGFYHTMEQIGPLIYRVILPGLLSGSKVVLTGHSRGGCLAILFAFMLATRGHRIQGLSTFGSPKVGDAEFVNHFRDKDHQLEEKRLSPVMVFVGFIYSVVGSVFILGNAILSDYAAHVWRRIGGALRRKQVS
jgi:hypothetical protein